MSEFCGHWSQNQSLKLASENWRWETTKQWTRAKKNPLLTEICAKGLASRATGQTQCHRECHRETSVEPVYLVEDMFSHSETLLELTTAPLALKWRHPNHRPDHMVDTVYKRQRTLTRPMARKSKLPRRSQPSGKSLTKASRLLLNLTRRASHRRQQPVGADAQACLQSVVLLTIRTFLLPNQEEHLWTQSVLILTGLTQLLTVLMGIILTTLYCAMRKNWRNWKKNVLEEQMMNQMNPQRSLPKYHGVGSPLRRSCASRKHLPLQRTFLVALIFLHLSSLLVSKTSFEANWWASLWKTSKTIKKANRWQNTRGKSAVW